MKIRKKLGKLKRVARARLWPKEPLTFLHVPKSAGTWLKEGLQSYYAPNSVLQYCPWEEVDGREKEVGEKYCLFASHIGAHKCALVGHETVTVLREPYARIMSLYSYWRETEKDAPGPIAAKKHDLKGFLKSKDPMVNFGFDNAQAYQIAYGHMPQERAHLDAKYSQEEILQMAKDNLDKMAVVGVVEDMPTFIEKLNKHFGFKLKADAPRVNVTKKKNKLTEKERRLIAPYVNLDVQLYDYARKKFSSLN